MVSDRSLDIYKPVKSSRIGKHMDKNELAQATYKSLIN